MEQGHALADAFMSAGPDSQTAGVDRAALETQLKEAVAAARAEHPGLRVDDATFCRHLGDLVGEDGGPLEGLSRLRCDELYLAFACGSGDAHAIARLREVFGVDIDRALNRARSTGVPLEELRQRVDVKLLAAGSDREPHILQYSGRGSLQGWIRVVVSRMVVDLLRSTGVRKEWAVAPTVLAEVVRADPDPQFEFLRDRYRDEVRGALEDAFAELAAKDRRLLRGLLVERLSTDDLGALHGVHRTTAARWVERARDRLMEGARASLRARVGGGEQTVRSLVAMVRSQLDLSVARLLASDTDPD